MFGGLDMSKMGEMLENIQKQAGQMQEKLEAVELISKSGGGMVEIKANGTGEIIDISIDNSLLDDKESLEILLISAINDIVKMVEDNKKSQAMNMMGGLSGAFK
jgi:DNA-binding YbaB/EbfC family protein